MQRSSSWFTWFTVLLAVVGGGLTRAQAEGIKPYFLVIVDTSGSMEWCAGGVQNNGAGATIYGSNDCSCRTDTTAGTCGTTPGGARQPANLFKTNRCNLPQNRIGDAKCALQRIVDGVGGDATFGLMQFEQPCNGYCGAPSVSMSTCGAYPTCDDGQLVVEIQDGNAAVLRQWVDGVDGPSSCDPANHRFPHELKTGLWTPIAKSLQRANEYLRGSADATFPFATDSNSIPASPIPESDPKLACRPVSVILLTDGDDTCAANATTDPPARAMELNTGDPKATTRAGKAFKTYVIGFGASGGNFNPAVLDDIATKGGTDSPDPTRKYFAAMNEAELSIALNQIVADAQPPIEVCNNLDDDCDLKVDEGLPKYCNKPMGVTGNTLCIEPPETLCDGQDDDCDGVIDEGLAKNACGVCGPANMEVCDNTDNDCDLRVDEDTNTMAPCGKDTGECKLGKLFCTQGAERCEGAIGPGKEICDCLDNDCDGIVDEEGDGNLCGENQRCAGCECREFCQKTDEFEARCRTPGLTPDINKTTGECLCIVDKCDHSGCPKSTIERDGMAECAPNNARVSECLCNAGACVPRCNGVQCDSGSICSPKTGRCVENNCRGLGCVTGQLCDPVAGRCVKDACMGVRCESDQACRDGKCETSCAKLQCKAGESCTHGSCVANKCATRICESGETCDARSGDCISDPCASKQCALGQACDSSSGTCEADPCWNVDCPTHQICVRGECALGGGAPPPAVTPAVTHIGKRVLATGGGGCACSVPGQPGRGSDTRGLGWLLCALGTLLATRKRRERLTRASAVRVLLGVLGVVTLGTLQGCRVSPICLDCVDSSTSGLDGSNYPAADSGIDMLDGQVDAGDAARDAEPDSAPVDAGPPKCVATGEETCNGKDDDCDFKVDEGVSPRTNNCNQAGVCAGTVPVCSSGNFVCRYSMLFETTETLCDNLDNDCDGLVDESFAQLGTSCEQGTGACRVTGIQRCNPSHTGLVCEVKSSLNPTEEVCNGKDDDCDGMVDEPKGTPGSNPSYVKDDVVKLRDDLWMYTYEASHVDAAADKAGIITARTCSRAGVLPWTNVTYDEAAAACQSVGMSLCGLNDWIAACRGASGSCNWSFTPAASGKTCNDFEAVGGNSCNGHDVNAMPGSPDTDALQATGGKPECFADFGNAGHVFDLSGNAKEWTVGPMSPDQNPLRGGSYDNNASGMRCDFDFTIGAKELRLANIGFRCCSNTAP